MDPNRPSPPAGAMSQRSQAPITIRPATSDARMGANQCFFDSKTIVSPLIRFCVTDTMSSFALRRPADGPVRPAS